MEVKEPQLRIYSPDKLNTQTLENKKEIDVISLFSGCGGMDLGFHQAGFNIKWANDIEQRACETYAKNIGNHIVCGDITQLDYSKIKWIGWIGRYFSCNGQLSNSFINFK